MPRLLGTEDVNTRHNDDRTPLHFAAQAAASELVALLLDSGADIDAVTDKGMPGDLLGDDVLGHGADRHCPLTASQGSQPSQGEHEKSYVGRALEVSPPERVLVDHAAGDRDSRIMRGGRCMATERMEGTC
ncbi:ankyrin repeat domain-containing protein [Nocardia anaemiae]|uniref:ankyrin repeat domain-containing protein n=1 Tax=Nocardia anaemiae TaxID=263910 RepID=UPI003530DD5D